jgi:hypothetical protein
MKVLTVFGVALILTVTASAAVSQKDVSYSSGQ